MKSGELDWWMNYFRSSNSNIFDLIKNAIVVAASDFPKEFSLQRDRIAEKLFTCNFSGPCEIESFKGGFDSKESKVDSTITGEETDEMDINQILECCFGHEEGLTDQIEENNTITAEVMKIKGIFQNFKFESDSVLLESLKHLRIMNVTFEILQSTNIGKAVSRLTKHGLEDIRNLTRSLIEHWKDVVDQWVIANDEANKEGTEDSTNPFVLDEEQLPSINNGISFATPTSIEFSDHLPKIVDCVDDDANKNHNKVEGVAKPKKPLGEKAAPRRFQRLGTSDSKFPRQEKVTNPIAKKPLLEGCPHNQDAKLTSDDHMKKFEATKRKLHQRYQEADLAKKQRTMRVVEIQDIPKQGVGLKNPSIKIVNRSRPNGRR